MTSTPPQEMPPQVRILDMLLGMMKTRAIHEAVRLNLAELVKDGPKSVTELAQETQTHAASLLRLLRALEGLGLFAEVEAGTYGQTALSHFLRPGVPGSMYDVAGIHGALWQWRPWEGLSYSLQTGKTAFDEIFGMPLFEYFARHPQEGKGFQQAMAGFSHQVDNPLAQGYDYSAFSSIVDIGGGLGSLLTAILRAHPQLTGVLFDLPSVIAAAREQIAASDIAPRCQLVAGDVFQAREIPQRADAYIMRQIIKDWHDEAVVQILSNCRQAMRPGGKILVAEQVILPGQRMQPAKLIDLQLMVVLSGQERTEAEYRALFEKAGLTLARIVPTHSPYSILECIAAQ
jgi:2-polyprenyl-3-methyl-5-hydroxy-6-metoxy-1,4-benzoquinol methylase